jgi:CheY-like chemotaxis protein
LRALIVDDYPDCGEALAAWFNVEGWDAESVTTAEEALARLQQCIPDVLVIEPYMRYSSGMSLAAGLRHKIGPSVWMIALTGHARVGDVAAYEPTLFDRTLIKPIDEAALRLALASRGRKSA